MPLRIDGETFEGMDPDDLRRIVEDNGPASPIARVILENVDYSSSA